MTVVLVIVAIAIASTLVLLGPSREGARAAGFARDVEAIVDGIRREYGMQDSYQPPNGALSLLTAISRGLIPPHLVVNAFAARDPWGRAIGVTSWPTTGTPQAVNTQFALTLSRPGDEVCTSLAVALLQMQPAELEVTAPSAAIVASAALRPTSSAIAGMAQAACIANTSVGTGVWRVVFD